MRMLYFRWLRVIAVAATLMLALGGRAHALCISPLCTCTVVITPVAFGSYNPLSSSKVDGSGNVRLTCGGVAGLAIPYSIAINPGAGSTNFTTRNMKNGSKLLPYNLYTEADYGTVWGDGTGSTGTKDGNIALDIAGLSPPRNYTIYGRIQGGQFTVIPGAYTDTLTVTVTYY